MLWGMPRRDKAKTSWRLIAAAVTFALFVVFDIFLFGWLILKSLSQREIEKVLLETRQEAEPLARELERQAAELGQEDLWVVMTVAQETTTYIDSVLANRNIVRRIEIRDRDGTKVYEKAETEEPPVESVEVLRVETGELPSVPLVDSVEVPIGELGTIVIGLSDEEVHKRIGVLRSDLTRQASFIGVLTTGLLAVALVALWLLFRRSRRLEEQAVEAERLAYIGTLASGLAHEIRNPLNSLNLNMQMLEEEVQQQGSGGSQLRLLSITRSELRRLEGLATDFLAYAKPRPMDLEDVPAAAVLDRVVEVLGGEIRERRAEVTVEDASAGERIRIDRNQINQLLLNLVHNALTAAEDAERSPVVRLAARREGGSVLLEVADNGPGIAAGDQQRIFDLFYSTRKGGTGLGLAIVQRIARAHDGEIEVGSVSGVGTTMRLRLPSRGKGREPVTAPLVGMAARSRARA